MPTTRIVNESDGPCDIVDEVVRQLSEAEPWMVVTRIEHALEEFKRQHTFAFGSHKGEQIQHQVALVCKSIHLVIQSTAVVAISARCTEMGGANNLSLYRIYVHTNDARPVVIFRPVYTIIRQLADEIETRFLTRDPTSQFRCIHQGCEDRTVAEFQYKDGEDLIALAMRLEESLASLIGLGKSVCIHFALESAGLGIMHCRFEKRR